MGFVDLQILRLLRSCVLENSAFRCWKWPRFFHAASDHCFSGKFSRCSCSKMAKHVAEGLKVKFPMLPMVAISHNFWCLTGLCGWLYQRYGSRISPIRTTHLRQSCVPQPTGPSTHDPASPATCQFHSNIMFQQKKKKHRGENQWRKVLKNLGGHGKDTATWPSSLTGFGFAPTFFADLAEDVHGSMGIPGS